MQMTKLAINAPPASLFHPSSIEVRDTTNVFKFHVAFNRTFIYSFLRLCSHAPPHSAPVALSGLQPVPARHEFILDFAHGLMLAVLVPPPQQGVHLVNEDNAGCDLVGQGEQRTHILLALAKPLGGHGRHAHIYEVCTWRQHGVLLAQLRESDHYCCAYSCASLHCPNGGALLSVLR